MEHQVLKDEFRFISKKCLYLYDIKGANVSQSDTYLLEQPTQLDVQAQTFNGFLSKCPTCKYMALDEDVGDMLCEMNNCATCNSTALDLLYEGIYMCDAYKEKIQ